MPRHTSGSHHYLASGTTYRPRLIILLCLLSLALPFTLCSLGTENRHDSVRRTSDNAAPVAVGFDLVQSYATSVAHFDNGTVIRLAKVSRSDEYTALMGRLVGNSLPPSGRLQPRGHLLGLWRLLMRSIGHPSSMDAEVLVSMTAALKAESEATLGRAIDSATVTAPWIPSWQYDVPYDSIINDVLVLVGIKPVNWEASDPTYLGEANSLLAASKRQLCPSRWCADDFDLNEQQPVAFFISLTNQSMHTSFQLARCFSLDSWDSELGTVDSRYGFDRLKDSEIPKDFWASVHEHLLTRVTEYSESHPGYSHLPFLVLVAGEAASVPEFTTVLQEVVKSIPNARVAGTKTDVRVQQEGSGRPGVELVVSDDPTFAAARRAAFWMRMRLDWSYCKAFYASHPREYLSQEHMIGNAHVEL